jgi:alkanesulfonate monooxygenase SsuD/methylene tetrahydromethanopterin reductase-like flavin-dependent oxidoreductase (luciferase family)
VEFGAFLLLQSPAADPPASVYQRGVEITQAAEDLGFGNMWLAEHHFSTYGYLSRPLMFALHLADRTRRIRVGTAVIVVPLHHPLVIAEEIATADVCSGGRLDVGLGRGYQRYEFERLGQDLGESRARWEEAVDIILLALGGRPFAYEGKYYRIPETTVFPRPVQTPHPPIWVTAQSPESIETTVKRGFHLLSGGFGVPIERLREFRRVFDGHVARFPPASPIRVGTQRPVYVTESEADARAAAEQARWNMRVTLSLRNNYERVDSGRALAVPFGHEPTTADLLEKFSVIGTPDTCIRQIRRLQEAMGIDHFNGSFWFGDLTQTQVLRSMRLFAEEVMPAFR